MCGCEGIRGTQHLAYYTAGKALDIDALKIFLAETLTAFMIPTAFMQLDSLPLTPNGKFNKKALPEPHITHGETIPPQNKRQQAIFDLIALIVGSEDFGITDDLFNIGLTLMAIKVSVMLHNKLGLDVKTGEIIHANH